MNFEKGSNERTGRCLARLQGRNILPEEHSAGRRSVMDIGGVEGSKPKAGGPVGSFMGINTAIGEVFPGIVSSPIDAITDRCHRFTAPPH
jgi:hypothetical protein